MTITKDELKDLLKNNVVTVNFKKKDNTVRKMVCTLSADYLPEIEPITEPVTEKKTKAESPDTVSVWDLEKQSWRSFRLDSIIDFNSNH